MCASSCRRSLLNSTRSGRIETVVRSPGWLTLTGFASISVRHPQAVTIQVSPLIDFHDTLKRVVFADELRNETVFRFFVQLIRRSQLLNSPIVKHSNTVRHRQSFCLVVGHVDGGNPQIHGRDA